MHRVIEVLTGHGWRLDQLFHSNAQLPNGIVPCNVFVFTRNMTLGARPPSMHFALEGVDEDSILVRGYTGVTPAGGHKKGISIGSEGEIVRDGKMATEDD